MTRNCINYLAFVVVGDRIPRLSSAPDDICHHRGLGDLARLCWACSARSATCAMRRYGPPGIVCVAPSFCSCLRCGPLQHGARCGRIRSG